MCTMPQFPNVYQQTFACSTKKDCNIAGALFSTFLDDASEILQGKAFCQAYILPTHNPITQLMHSWPVICSHLSALNSARVNTVLKHEPGRGRGAALAVALHNLPSGEGG